MSFNNGTSVDEILRHLGLEEYEERLVENGFDDWTTLTAITESDLQELDFKLGDRRKLQEAIKRDRIMNPSDVETEDGKQFRATDEHGKELSPTTVQQATRTTRTYRRHPKPDAHAPSRPKTAYILFGEHVRKDPALAGSSFAELARTTGRRWGRLSQDERVNTWEKPAGDRLAEYKKDVEVYRQTEDYRSYTTYLDECRKRQQELNRTEEQVSSGSGTATAAETSAPSDTRGSEATTPSFVMTEERETPEHVDYEHLPLYATSSVRSGLEEVRRISTALGVELHKVRVTPYPPEDMTATAVRSFLRGTGNLLYFWNQDEASNLVKSTYHGQHGPNVAYAAEVFAMSAVGSYCDAESHKMMEQEQFLHIFLHQLLSPEISNLRYMRLFACLAICRFTSSVESARSLILSALEIGRQAFTSLGFAATSSEDEKRYWWDIFRSIIFLESWFGYNTNHESRISSQDLNVAAPAYVNHSWPPANVEQLIRPPRSDTKTRHGVFQERVSELGQLATYIALDLKTATQPKVAQARVHFESLNEWHRTLPPPIQLSRLSLADPQAMTWHTK